MSSWPVPHPDKTCGVIKIVPRRVEPFGFKPCPFDQAPAGDRLDHKLTESPDQGVDMIR